MKGKQGMKVDPLKAGWAVVAAAALAVGGGYAYAATQPDEQPQVRLVEPAAGVQASPSPTEPVVAVTPSVSATASTPAAPVPAATTAAPAKPAPATSQAPAPQPTTVAPMPDPEPRPSQPPVQAGDPPTPGTDPDGSVGGLIPENPPATPAP